MKLGGAVARGDLTADFSFVEERIQALEHSLLNTSQSWAALQVPEGGYWGPGFGTWYNRVSYMVGPIGDLMTSNQVRSKLQQDLCALQSSLCCGL